MAHGIQHLGFGIAEPHAERHAPGVLGDRDRERAEPADRVGRQTQQALRRDHRRERPGVGDAAENRQQQPAIRHRGDRAGRTFRDHQLQHFHAHAFGGKRGEAGAAGNAGEISGAIRFARAIGGMNAEEPEDAQVILGDARGGIADEAHAPGADIIQSADVIMHHAIGIDRQAVDGEIAPLGVADPVAAERHRRLAAEGLGILAQRGDLERLRVDHQRHGAVLDTGRHALDPGRLGAADHLGRQRSGRDIDIADRNPQQRIADRAANHAGFFAAAVEQSEHAGGWTRSEPGRVRQHARFTHFSAPGTNLPFSICAGT